MANEKLDVATEPSPESPLASNWNGVYMHAFLARMHLGLFATWSAEFVPHRMAHTMFKVFLKSGVLGGRSLLGYYSIFHSLVLTWAS